VYDIQKECPDLHPSLADRKIVKRHLEAEVKLGELEKLKEIDGTTYVWKR
jgi:hypothetical protein